MTNDVTAQDNAAQNDARTNETERTFKTTDFMPRIEELLHTARAEVARAKRILALLDNIEVPPKPAPPLK